MSALRVIAPPFERAYRIIPSRFPPAGLFDGIASRDELALLFEIEGRTNPRINTLGRLELVDREDWVTGPGSTPIMAAFTHPSPAGSRFSDGSFGLYYCADSSDVAVRETAYHRERMLRLTREGPIRLEMRQYVGTLAKPLHDGRGRKLTAGALDPNSYAVSQPIGAALRAAKSWGLAYPSVRLKGGTCAALMRPPAIESVVQSTAFHYVYDGERVVDVYPLGKAIRLS